MSAARQAYAQARVQARFGRRPAEHDFRLLDASRSIAHLQEALRHGPLAQYVAGLDAAPDSDAFEASLRTTWRAACAEVARWHAPEWRLAFATFCAHADLPALELLRADGSVPAWLHSDDHLGPLLRSEGEARMELLRRTCGPAIAAAYAADGPLQGGWLAAWRASAPRAPARVAAHLAEIGSLQGALYANDELRIGVRVARLERLFRTAAGTPVAGFAYLGLLAITLQRIRGGRAVLLVAEISPS